MGQGREVSLATCRTLFPRATAHRSIHQALYLHQCKVTGRASYGRGGKESRKQGAMPPSEGGEGDPARALLASEAMEFSN